MTNWRKFKNLSWSERWLLVQALFILPLTGLALRLLSLRRFQSALICLAPLNSALIQDQPESLSKKAKVIARMVKVAVSYGPYRAKCLVQSLTLWWLLRRQGIESDLRIGTRKNENRFEAHAWVELLGIPLNDSSDVHQRFAVFERIIEPLESRPL